MLFVAADMKFNIYIYIFGLIAAGGLVLVIVPVDSPNVHVPVLLNCVNKLIHQDENKTQLDLFSQSVFCGQAR